MGRNREDDITPLQQETHKRGVRGAFLVNTSLDLPPESSRSWQFVADVEQTQAQVIELQKKLGNPSELAEAIGHSVAEGSDRLSDHGRRGRFPEHGGGKRIDSSLCQRPVQYHARRHF